MGDRAQIAIVVGDDKKKDRVYLYSHWGGTEIKQTLAQALNLHQRWDDCEYLARIIFRQMGAGGDGETGFGIGIAEHGDVEYPVMVVDTETQMVSEETAGFDHTRRSKPAKLNSITFEQFIKKNLHGVEEVTEEETG